MNSLNRDREKLNKLLESVEIVENVYPEPATIKPYSFCPKCGSRKTKATGNMAEYPESYIKVFCGKCGFLVACQDNSPFIHCLECKDNNYEIEI